MIQVKAVIGSAYGDEGKGMWTDYLVRTSPDPIVVRANGGAQVGHTVIKDDKRFIFSHMGSGTLRGAPTIYTRHSVVNPVLFLKEIEGRNAGLNPKILISRFAPVTTPYDMLLNQCRETALGINRHGSTGVGFGVTLERMEQGINLSYGDLQSGIFCSKLKNIINWCKNLLPIPFDEFTEKTWQFFKEPGIIDLFMEDCVKFCNKTKEWDESFDGYKTVIFENGQGLMLDQEYGTFPHVTRSNTGFRNIGKIMKSMGIFNKVPTEVYYLSRCYTTRHGAGPLPYDNHSLLGIIAQDDTNVTNEYQGTLRLAPLNLYNINKAIEWDKNSHPSNAPVYKVVTCCDQISEREQIKYIDTDSNLRFAYFDQFQSKLDEEFDIMSFSPRGDTFYGR